MKIKDKIKEIPWLKTFIHRIIIPKREARPRWFIKLLVNPWFHFKGRKSRIRRYVRKDLVPFNYFHLGQKSIIEDFATLNNGVGDLWIGNNTRVGLGNVLIAPLTIGSNCILAQNIVISGLNHLYEHPEVPIKDQGVETAKVIIEDNCWIGANVSIVAGITIGKNSVIGAGSVVTKTIPPYHVAVGNPARLIKKFDFETGKWEKIREEVYTY